jgi:hypothetical protein
MTWANVDDLFPEHPKVLAAGGDAAWLYICGLCFTNRNLTEGRIPKAVVPRLSDRKAPMRLAKRLVDVGLWHEDEDAYVIHDWEKYNEGAEKVKARKEQARNAARVKWSKHAKSTAPRNTGSTAHAHAPPPDEQCDEHAGSMPGADAGAMPSHSSPTTEHRSSSSHHGAGGRLAEEEEPSDRITQACAVVAQRRLDRRLTKPELEPITDRPAWLARAADRERQRIAGDPGFADNMTRLVAGGLSVNQLADLIDPPERPAPSPYPAAGEQLPPAFEIDEATGMAVPVSA